MFVKKKQEIRTPNYYCNTCTHCVNHNHCKIHNRHVIDDWNRCFFHSTYAPIQATLLQHKLELKDIQEYNEAEDLLQLVG